MALTKLSTEDEQKVTEMMSSGKVPVREVCERFDITRVTAHRIAARHGVRRPVGRQPVVLSKTDIDDIVELGRQKVSQREIGLKYGYSQSRISKILSSHGVHNSKGRNRRGEKHGSWKGGIHKAATGYVWELVAGDDPMISMRTSNGYVLQHRLVMARHLGRPLTKAETVHHINGVRDDNRLENLELWIRPQPRGVRSDEKQHCATCSCWKGA